MLRQPLLYLYDFQYSNLRSLIFALLSLTLFVQLKSPKPAHLHQVQQHQLL